MGKIQIRKYQAHNSKNPAMDGRWYGRIEAGETLTTNDLCRHIQKHGSIFTADVVKGVIEKFVSCFEELLLEGNKIKLGGLGTFYLSAQTTGADSEGEFTADHVKSIRMRFLADQSKESEYTASLLTNKAKVRMLGAQESTSGSGNSGSDSGDSGNTGGVPIDEMP